jgi:hypothetical protein
MPPRRRNQPQSDAAPTSPAGSGGGQTPVSTLVVRRSAGPVRKPSTRSARPIDPQYRQAVELSVAEDTGLAITYTSAEDAKLGVAELRRAAYSMPGDYGLSVSTVEGDGEWVVDFRVLPQRRQRRYTSADVREWAAGEGFPPADLRPKILAHVRAAYRDAHGYNDGEDN